MCFEFIEQRVFKKFLKKLFLIKFWKVIFRKLSAQGHISFCNKTNLYLYRCPNNLTLDIKKKQKKNLLLLYET